MKTDEVVQLAAKIEDELKMIETRGSTAVPAREPDCSVAVVVLVPPGATAAVVPTNDPAAVEVPAPAPAPATAPLPAPAPATTAESPAEPPELLLAPPACVGAETPKGPDPVNC